MHFDKKKGGEKKIPIMEYFEAAERQYSTEKSNGNTKKRQRIFMIFYESAKYLTENKTGEIIFFLKLISFLKAMLCFCCVSKNNLFSFECDILTRENV